MEKRLQQVYISEEEKRREIQWAEERKRAEVSQELRAFQAEISQLQAEVEALTVVLQSADKYVTEIQREAMQAKAAAVTSLAANEKLDSELVQLKGKLVQQGEEMTRLKAESGAQLTQVRELLEDKAQQVDKLEATVAEERLRGMECQRLREELAARGRDLMEMEKRLQQVYISEEEKRREIQWAEERKRAEVSQGLRAFQADIDAERAILLEMQRQELDVLPDLHLSKLHWRDKQMCKQRLADKLSKFESWYVVVCACACYHAYLQNGTEPGLSTIVMVWTGDPRYASMP